MSKQRKISAGSYAHELVVCSHASTKLCPLSARRCPHKRPHCPGGECEPNECQTTKGEDGKWQTIRVSCVPQNGGAVHRRNDDEMVDNAGGADGLQRRI
jgi:hypothetical protein